MVTLAGVKADDKSCIRACTNAADCIFKTGDWKFKKFCDIFKLPIGYAHTPYKIANIGNVLLVGLFCKHDATAPWYTTFINTLILK